MSSGAIDFGAPHGRRARAALATASAALLAGLGQACIFDWDHYDPRLTSSGTGGTTTMGTGAAGGSGGAPTTATSGGSGGSGAAGGGTGAAGGSGGSGGSGGTGGSGGGGGAKCGGTDLLSDDFNDGATGVPWYWVADPGAAVSESSGEGVIALPAGSPGPVYGAFQTKRYYDLRKDSVSVKVTSVAAPATARTFLVARYDGGDYIEISQKNGQISCVKVMGGMVSPLLTTTYKPLVHVYWQFREANGKTYFETSADGSFFTPLTSVNTNTLFDLSSVRIDLGGSLDGNEATPSEAHFDDVNGGLAPSGKWCPASTLTDDFDDGTPGRTWLRSYDGGMGGCTVAEQAGELVVQAPAGQTSYCAYESSSSYDLTGSEVLVEVPQISDPATNAEVFLRLEVEGEGTLEITQTQSKVELRLNKDGMITPQGSAMYTADTRWWRLQEMAGMIYLDCSPDGATWNPVTNLADPLTMTAVDVVLGGGTYMALAAPLEAHFDHVNLAP